MKTALIGYTGFVGSSLANQYKFSDLYNSKNIENIVGKSYDLVVSAGTYALRWKANQEPLEDWKAIKRLLDCLKKVSVKHFILISTIDVYPQKDGVDEDTKIKLKDHSEAYGRNRFKMEQFIKRKFTSHTIIRCPQIYGPGVKKGFIYDLIYDNALDFTHKDTLLQFYWAPNFKKDIEIARKSNISLINFAVEPTTAYEVAKSGRGMNFKTVTEKPPMKFDMQTKYSSLYGKKGRYIYGKKETLKQLKDFIQKERKKLKK